MGGHQAYPSLHLAIPTNSKPRRHSPLPAPTHTSKMVKRGGASKFPVARIKKIMQADEDIGKVAQATPVVICEHRLAKGSSKQEGRRRRRR